MKHIWYALPTILSNFICQLHYFHEFKKQNKDFISGSGHRPKFLRRGWLKQVFVLLNIIKEVLIIVWTALAGWAVLLCLRQTCIQRSWEHPGLANGKVWSQVGFPWKMLEKGEGIWATGCWMLDAGCWMLDAGCWMLDAGCWMLDAVSNYCEKYTFTVKITRFQQLWK